MDHPRRVSRAVAVSLSRLQGGRVREFAVILAALGSVAAIALLAVADRLFEAWRLWRKRRRILRAIRKGR